MIKRVCVFGSYKSLGKKKREDIVRLGGLLAEKGIEVISGGFGGTMEDISRGAKKVGGKTLKGKMSAEQWGMGRVYSFVMKQLGTWGRADKDLAEKVKKKKIKGYTR